MHIRAIRHLSLRDASEADTKAGVIGILDGYAAVFETDSVEFDGWDGPWIERIARGAFTRTLRDKPDVVALWSHDVSRPIARAPETLALREDEHGLHVEIRLVDTALNRDTIASVRAGLVDSMSFGFEARSVRWDDDTDREIRTLLDVDLHEVSPVVWPAYPAAKVGARSAVRLSSGAGDELRAIKRERDEHFRLAAAAAERRAYLARLRRQLGAA